MSTTLAYDTTGQIVQSTDPAGNATQFSYNDRYFNDNNANPPASYSPPTPTHAYATSITRPIIGTSTIGYYWTGQLATATDENGASAYFHFYDPLNRATSSIDAAGGWALSTYPSTTEIDNYIGIQDAAPSSGCSSCSHTQQFRDNMGRFSAATVASDPGGSVTSSTSYDANNRVIGWTNPYRTTNDATFGIYNPFYDPLDRVTSVVRPDGNVVSYGYGAAAGAVAMQCGGLGYPTVSISETSRTRLSWQDGFNRIIEVDEPDSSGAFSIATCYQYDALNNLTGVIQRGGTTDSSQWRSRTFTYDGLSRLTAMTLPELGPSSASNGTTSLYYTTAGGALCNGSPQNVCRRVDPRGITTTYAYDALNRLTGKTYSDTTAAVTYFYDQASYNGLSIAYGKGRRTGMADGSGNTAWSYDAAGRAVAKRETITGITKTTGFSYNRDGSVASISYPSGRVITYVYNNAEQPVSAVDATNHINFVTNAMYSAPGMLASAINGQTTGWNAITRTLSYNSRLEATRIQAVSPVPLTLFDLSYSYDQGGGKNDGSVVQAINNRDNTRSIQYTYDQLNRIASASTISSNLWGDSFVLDNWGNLLQKNVTKGTAESLSLSVNAKNRVVGYTYDNAGNLTSDTFNGLSFDAENRANPTGATILHFSPFLQSGRKAFCKWE